MADNAIDGLIAKLSTADQANPKAIANTLQAVSNHEQGHAILASLFQNGQDPLEVLHPANMTLPYLYILNARLSVTADALVHTKYIRLFCQQFQPLEARLVPEGVSILAKHIQRIGDQLEDLDFTLEAFSHLVARYPPSPSHLTAIHPFFLLACIRTKHFAGALPVLSTPLTEFDRAVSDIDYTDSLQFFYLGGIIYGALKRYTESEEFLENAVSHPSLTPSAIQIEAYKKLTLIQLILHGRTKPPPKYTSSALIKQMKGLNQYSLIVRHYPTVRGPLAEMLAKENTYFQEDGNRGLLNVAIEYAPRWAIRNLMKTYSSLSLVQVARMTDLQNEDAARLLTLRMISEGQLSASLSVSEGTIAFNEDELDSAAFEPTAIQEMLIKTQRNERALKDLMHSMEGSKNLLAKALKERDGSGAFGGERGIVPDDFEGWRGGQEALFE